MRILLRLSPLSAISLFSLSFLWLQIKQQQQKCWVCLFFFFYGMLTGGGVGSPKRTHQTQRIRNQTNGLQKQKTKEPAKEGRKQEGLKVENVKSV